MRLLSRLKSRLAVSPEPRVPMIDVAVDLGLKLTETSTAHAGRIVREFRAEGHALQDGEPRRVLREVVFLQVHLVERFATPMLKELAADLFLRTFVPVTLGMYLQSQFPEMPEAEREEEVQRVLLPAFDEVNAAYARRVLSVPAVDVASLGESVIGHFGGRIGVVAGVRGSALPFTTAMPLVPAALKQLAIPQRLGELPAAARR